MSGGNRVDVERIVKRNAYSARAWLLALFVVFALVLGGGGSPNPSTEFMLEEIFVLFAIVWLWLPGQASADEPAAPDRLALVLVAIPLIIPVVQLIPLPPSIWTALPGRENAVAALSLIGEQGAWRPISLSPRRTLSSLLAIVPAVFCLYAVSRLDTRERRLIIATIFAMAIATALLGAVQVTAGGKGLNLYPQHHIGWVTGFQANRNATADVLLIGILALAALVAPYLVGTRHRRPLRLDRQTFAMLAGGLAILLFIATVMTGSRTGTLLLIVAGATAIVVFAFSRDTARPLSRSFGLISLVVVLVAGLSLAFLILSDVSAVSRVTARFADMDSPRSEIWKDTWFALKQYWPVGFGLGGFEPAMLPAERLEVLVPAIPNRAHNDFLEIGLEAGFLGYAIVLAAGAVSIGLAWRSWRAAAEMRPQVIFGLGVLLVLALHSIVDYPLRSMALACLSGVAAGVLVRNRVSVDRPVALGRVNDLKGFA